MQARYAREISGTVVTFLIAADAMQISPLPPSRALCNLIQVGELCTVHGGNACLSGGEYRHGELQEVCAPDRHRDKPCLALYPRSVIHVELGNQAYVLYLIDVAHAAAVSARDVDDIHARLPGALEEFDVVFDSAAVAKIRFVEHREPDAQRHRQIRMLPFAVPQPSQY